MIKKPAVATLALIALQLGIASTGTAQERGLLLGVGIGGSTFETDEFDIDFSVDGVPLFTTQELDDSDTAFHGSVGYQFSPYLSAEAEYLDLGELVFMMSGAVPGSSMDVLSLRIETGAKGYAASVIGSMPLSDRWDLFGRVGLLFSERTTTVRVDDSSIDDSERSKTMTLGIGGALALRERLALRFEYRAFGDDVSTVTLGLVFRPIR
jgi:OmpA-OmpF porin, OOP family